MIKIGEVVRDYALRFAPEFDVIVETASGINVRADYTKLKSLIWVNINEKGIVKDVYSGLKTQLQRTVEISFGRDCVKEDEGENYDEIKYDLYEEATNLFYYLTVLIPGITAVSFATGVDVYDQNMVVVKLTVSFEDDLERCELFKEFKNPFLGKYLIGPGEIAILDKMNTPELLEKFEDARVAGYLNKVYGYNSSSEFLDEDGNIVYKEPIIDDDWISENIKYFYVGKEGEIKTDSYGTYCIFITPKDLNFEASPLGMSDSVVKQSEFEIFYGENFNVIYAPVKGILGDDPNRVKTFWDWKTSRSTNRITIIKDGVGEISKVRYDSLGYKFRFFK